MHQCNGLRADQEPPYPHHSAAGGGPVPPTNTCNTCTTPQIPPRPPLSVATPPIPRHSIQEAVAGGGANPQSKPYSERKLLFSGLMTSKGEPKREPPGPNIPGSRNPLSLHGPWFLLVRASMACARLLLGRCSLLVACRMASLRVLCTWCVVGGQRRVLPTRF